jgi:hypothetical protein
MRVTISFYNAAGTSDLQDISYQVTGNSPAWRGAVEGSGFSEVNQQVTVPAGATQFLMQLVSGGNNSTTGIMIIDDLSIALSTSSSILADNFWPNPSFTNGVNLSKTTGTPAGWVRNGTDTTNAQVITRRDRESANFAFSNSLNWNARRIAVASSSPFKA